MNVGLRLTALLGRVLLGLYFFLPGIMKLQDASDAAAVMLDRDIPYAEIFLPIAIGVEIIAGLALILGFRVRFATLVLIVFVAATNMFIHNFWALPSMDYATEFQMFTKNIAVIAGLLFVFGTGGGPYRLSHEGRDRG
jgi:putative oxidoreductase